MNPVRTAFPLLLLAASACGSPEAPKAAPGAVERTIEQLERNEAAEQAQAIREAEREEKARAKEAERRIRASDR